MRTPTGHLGTAQEASFHELIDAVNTDPKVRIVAHVGDIKSGSTTCTDDRFAAVASAFATFEDPLVYTPGDNEWTDCHRPNNGAFNPLERLNAVRSVFFAEPGDALGRRPMAVDGQVLLLQGDSHDYTVDNPLGLPNFTRIVVHGETLPFEYLRLTVDPRADALFSWERVPVATL